MKTYVPYVRAEEEAPVFTMDNLPLMHRQYQFKQLEGKFLTLVESMGLSDKQEHAIKSYVRRELWDFVRDGLVIPDESDLALSPKMETGR
jgi:hypothetical protein